MGVVIALLLGRVLGLLTLLAIILGLNIIAFLTEPNFGSSVKKQLRSKGLPLLFVLLLILTPFLLISLGVYYELIPIGEVLSSYFSTFEVATIESTSTQLCNSKQEETYEEAFIRKCPLFIAWYVFGSPLWLYIGLRGNMAGPVAWLIVAGVHFYF